MTKSGIDTTTFGSHSARAAAVSKAKMNLVPVNEILCKAGWSNEKTFGRFYDKRVNNKERIGLKMECSRLNKR